ncbi:MAG: FAD-binding oxidoreductase [Acetobacteraceae bacterium]|nr:FAD-binding oxidoreductase [Acetobacteraceae bacterium]
MPDLIVIGGGIVGGAIAWGAARLGASVALLDEGDIAFRAARGNFGLVWVQSKGAGLPPYAHWSRRSSELWPGLAGSLQERTGIDTGLRQPGGFMFCLSDEEYESRASVVQRMHNESGDIGTRMMDRAEVRAMVPGLGDRVVGAAFCPIDGHASPLYLLRALHTDGQASGVAYHPNCKVDAIDAAPNDFTVRSGADRFSAPRVVIAAGLGSRDLAPMVGLNMPVTPLQGQIIVTERLPRFLDYVTHVTRQTEEGTVMVGDSQEDAGFDILTKVSTLSHIAARNIQIFPALAAATIVRTWAALRVMSPDGFPIYEQSERYPGAFAATCHSGVTLAGAHALALAPAIMRGELPSELAAFSAQRFGS